MSYRKLTARRRGLFGYSQLWLGEDHLLLVRSARLVENYQRFALRDIQAIVISDGPDLRAIQALVVLLSLGWAALALAASSTFGRSFFLVTGGVALGLAILDIARGPRCRCVLHTAVSKEPLSPVCRRNATWKFLAAVIPAVEAVQGPVNLEQVQRAGAGAEAELKPPDVNRERTYIAEILFGLLPLDAALLWVVLRTFVPNAGGLSPTVYLTELVLVGVLMAQRRTLKPALFAWGLVTAVLIAADISTLSGVAAFGVLVNTMRIAELHRDLSSLWLSPRPTAIAAAAWRVGAGAIGLALCFLDRRRKTA